MRDMKKYFLVITMVCASFFATRISSQTTAFNDYFTIENYYKVKWGFADEFIGLWKANHYPLLKKAKERGDIISIVAETPKIHNSEESSWDFKVSITFKNAALAFAHDLTTPYKAQLYKDLDKLAKDEQHRFELLIAHWDVPVDQIGLE